MKRSVLLWSVAAGPRARQRAGRAGSRRPGWPRAVAGFARRQCGQHGVQAAGSGHDRGGEAAPRRSPHSPAAGIHRLPARRGRGKIPFRGCGGGVRVGRGAAARVALPVVWRRPFRARGRRALRHRCRECAAGAGQGLLVESGAGVRESGRSRPGIRRGDGGPRPRGSRPAYWGAARSRLERRPRGSALPRRAGTRDIQLARGRVERAVGNSDSALAAFQVYLAVGGDSGRRFHRAGANPVLRAPAGSRAARLLRGGAHQHRGCRRPVSVRRRLDRLAGRASRPSMRSTAGPPVPSGWRISGSGAMSPRHASRATG